MSQAIAVDAVPHRECAQCTKSNLQMDPTRASSTSTTAARWNRASVAPRIHIVTKSWLVDSTKQGIALDERTYAPEGLPVHDVRAEGEEETHEKRTLTASMPKEDKHPDTLEPPRVDSQAIAHSSSQIIKPVSSGNFDKMEQARNDVYFHKMQVLQLENRKKELISHFDEQIAYHQAAIDRLSKHHEEIDAEKKNRS